ncbi:MAG: fructose-specific PTS transporter subunit EIIC [Lactobacillus sp.]|jgi:PTS system fructose-specific IIC component|nr:fructose-specific PTS transporter subunit EIIC [Lactobacillus sp.]
MLVTDVFDPNLIILDLKAKDAQQVISSLCKLAQRAKVTTDAKLLEQKIWQREREVSTGVGHGIAMPHAQGNFINRTCVIVAKTQSDIDFSAIDHKPVNLFFMLLAPAGADSVHLKILAELSRLLLDQTLLTKIKAANSPQAVIELFKQAEQAKSPRAESGPKKSNLIVGVTACINGIAHTYMAEAALQQAGKQRGWQVRIETNGSEGARHQLTAEEIKQAQGVIIAADKQVAMARFAGKRLVDTSTAAAITDPDRLFEQVQTAPIFHPQNADHKELAKSMSNQQSGLWRQILDGISYLLPFSIASGIILAIARICFDYHLTDAASFLTMVGQLTIKFMIPVLAAFTGEAIANRPALLLGFVGGALCQLSSGQKARAGILGGLCAGLLAGAIIIVLQKIFRPLPTAIHGLKPMIIFPVFGLLAETALVYFLIVPLFGQINYWLLFMLKYLPNWGLTLVTICLSLMMAADLGGPINKTAYLLAVAVFVNAPALKLLAILMAAVMTGGMVPPLATAWASLFLKKS